MRLLLDNNLSPRPVDMLTGEGWDVTHVGALGLRAATDAVVLRTAHDDDRILVSADTNFAPFWLLLAIQDRPSCSYVASSAVASRTSPES